MYEILRLILTGTREQRLKRFNLILMVLAIAEVALAVCMLFISDSVHISVPILLGIFLAVIGVVNTVMTVKRSSLTNGLIAEQLQSDGLADDEFSTARRSLAEKYLNVFGKQKRIYSIISNSPVIFYILSAVFSILLAADKMQSAITVPILFAVGTLSGIVLGIFSASLDTNHRTDLYEQADSEIKILKRYAGIDERDIQKQSYTARNTATRSQELFLCDPADRAELRKTAKIMGIFSIVLTIAFVMLINLMTYLPENSDTTYIAVLTGCLIAMIFFIWAAVTVWTEIRRRAVYRRNEAKLTDSEADGMRRFLQNEFIKLQKRGNIFFSVFCGVPTLTGFILGVIGIANDPSASFVQNVAGVTVFFFIASGLLAILIWCIIYAVYRKKVKPVELQLSNMQGL